MSFTVKSRVNYPLSISLDESESIHLGPYDSKIIDDDKYRDSLGVTMLLRNRTLVIVPPAQDNQVIQAQSFTAKANDGKDEAK